MRRVPIRLKLTAALIVPLAALLVVTWLEVRSLSAEVDEVRAQADLAELSLGPSSLVRVLQQERAAAAVYLIGQEDAFSLEVESNAEARTLMDEAIARFRADVGSSGPVAAAYEPALEALDALDRFRAEVDSAPDAARNLGNVDMANRNFNGYTDVMEVVFDASRRVTSTIRDDELRRGAVLFDLCAHQTDVIARMVRDLLLPAVSGDADGVNTPPEVRAVAESLSQLRSNEQAIRVNAQGDYAPLAEALLSTDHIIRFPQLAQQALDTGAVDIPAVAAGSTGTDPAAFGYTVFREDVGEMLTRQAADTRAAADARLARFMVLGALATALAVAATWLVSRSITRPLRSLDRQARTMADHALPTAVRDILETPPGEDVRMPTVAPITVRSRDEVADVVTALNTVQESALDLAVEQAVLRRNLADSFVNLGRRNQNLLGRQLDFITELESSEADADVLASLFRLDHLATRMRRNAESLLVLAGIEPPRKWSAPLRLGDVIRAALGEVEDYQRVVVRELEPATVMGTAGADLAHLLAEFVENALTFSPPDEPVDVRGRRRPDGGYALAVVDGGFGMAPGDIELANRRLAGGESFTVAPSKYLGHYVAGHLAARHGIHARLQPGARAGITVVVELPPHLLADARPPMPPGAPPAARHPRHLAAHYA